MAVLRSSDVKKMNDQQLREKLQDLRLELVRGSVTANKANAKTKELKRAIARILTVTNAKKSQVKLSSSVKKEGLKK